MSDPTPQREALKLGVMYRVECEMTVDEDGAVTKTAKFYDDATDPETPVYVERETGGGGLGV